MEMIPTYSASASSASECELVLLSGEKGNVLHGFALRSPVHFDDNYDEDYDDFDEDDEDDDE